jgi:hypothetical protein
MNSKVETDKQGESDCINFLQIFCLGN